MVGRVLIKALVWPTPKEVAFVLTEHCAGVFLVVDQKPAHAIGPDGPNEAFVNAFWSAGAEEDTGDGRCG